MTFGGGLGRVDSDSLDIAVGPGDDGFFGETAQGGPVENQGFIVTDTGNHAPVVTTAPAYTIPLRTPFALTGSATDSDGDTVTYMWEQNDRGAQRRHRAGQQHQDQRPAVPPVRHRGQRERHGHAADARRPA